ncbi:MAG: hypothetical protein ACIAZJ_01365 [Gimesia chilikensis]|uniref:hypothetical protein n=1 Tax=Gimesia chilikensis TaxID=2605989 RepID=UPI0037BA0F21
MKISCYCGEMIFDSTDNLPQKGRLIPDQDWLEMFDALEVQVMERLAAGTLSFEAACMKMRELICSPVRGIWQCAACGRLYIDDLDGQLQCFLPEKDETDKRVLRGV